MANLIIPEELLTVPGDLPSGTILFEKYGNAGGGGGTPYELILPTAQEIEIICVGGGSPVVGTAIDL